MKITFVAILFCLFAAIPAMADVTKADIQKLLAAKVSDSVIVEYVKTNAPVRMTASDLVSLKNAGATDNVLTALAQYMSTAAPTPQVETVYVYNTYSYSGWYGWYGWYSPGYRCYHPYYYRPVYRPVVVRPVCRPAPVQPHGGRHR
jgi:hypothetical protein